MKNDINNQKLGVLVATYVTLPLDSAHKAKDYVPVYSPVYIHIYRYFYMCLTLPVLSWTVHTDISDSDPLSYRFIYFPPFAHL